jgi:hypothetical protein
MIQMDIPAAFVCSQIFAYNGRHWLGQQPTGWTGRFAALSGCYAMGIIGACGIYLYSGWTEWEMMYWTEWVRMDTENFGDYGLALVAPLFLLALGVAAIFGFHWAHLQIARGRPRRVWWAIWIGIAISLGMVLITPAAPMLVGHYHDYHAYIDAARASGNAWDYGVVAVGPWTACVPFAAEDALLQRHGLITFFGPRFFIPWLIDILIFVGSAWYVARWFRAPPQPG